MPKAHSCTPDHSVNWLLLLLPSGETKQDKSSYVSASTHTHNKTLVEFLWLVLSICAHSGRYHGLNLGTRSPLQLVQRITPGIPRKCLEAVGAMHQGRHRDQLLPVEVTHHRVDSELAKSITPMAWHPSSLPKAYKPPVPSIKKGTVIISSLLRWSSRSATKSASAS